MQLKVIVPPVSEPVDIDFVKQYIREYNSDFDTMIAALIVLVRENAEDYQNRSYLTRTLEYSVDSLIPIWISLPKPPFQSLESITFFDVYNYEYPMNLDDFIVDSNREPALLRLKYNLFWPTTCPRDYDCLVIRYKAGVDSPLDVSMQVRIAIAMGVDTLFNNPSGDMPTGFYSLLGFRRIVPV